MAIVVQRYGVEINGGAEYHARLIARHLGGRHDVEVLTTCAADYVTWAQHYPEGTEEIEGISVRRFRVDQERDPRRFGDLQNRILREEHPVSLEFDWMREQGPVSSAMKEYLLAHQAEYDLFIFFSFRYYTTFTLLPLFAERSILVPTAEHDDIIYLRLFKSFFQLPAAIAYNSEEEMALIRKLSQNEEVPGVVVGIGSEIPSSADERSFREKYRINEPYLFYVGRLDENKGVPILFDYFQRHLQEHPQDPLMLVLAGKTIIDIPDHPRIRHIGFIDDQDKFNGLQGAELLVIPSQYESLSMVTLEAWAMGKPVLANGRTEVLRGQCRRSNAGLWFDNYQQFSAALQLLEENKALREAMGRNGRDFFVENYSWPVIEEKYERLIRMVEEKGLRSSTPA